MGERRANEKVNSRGKGCNHDCCPMLLSGAVSIPGQQLWDFASEYGVAISLKKPKTLAKEINSA
jgi:hypothetical protein